MAIRSATVGISNFYADIIKPDGIVSNGKRRIECYGLITTGPLRWPNFYGQ